MLHHWGECGWEYVSCADSLFPVGAMGRGCGGEEGEEGD